MATLRDIAILADVSVTTASRVLNGSSEPHAVSADTRAAVHRAASQLGYRRSASARALKSGRSNVVGVIASDFLDSYYGELTRGIEAEAARAGFATVFASADRAPVPERQTLSLLREHAVAGVVFCGSGIEGLPGLSQLISEVGSTMADGARVVALAPRHFGSAELVVDNVATGYELTKYFVELGHRSICFVGGTRNLTSAEMRISGYEAALSEAGLRSQVVGREGMSVEHGLDVAQTLIAANDRPTAILCTNDDLAVGVLAGLWQAGISVPGEVSVGTVGGTRIARAFDITAIALPLEELGRLAARFITDPSSHPSPPATPGFTLRPGITSAPPDRAQAN